jgi:nucleotide-binding universal stress UspA family protein
MTAMGPVVLGVVSEDLVTNLAGMEFALHEARQRGVRINVVHGCSPRHQLIPTDSWVESERRKHGGRVVGRIAQQLRRMSRYEVEVDVTNADASGVDALLTASTSASVVVLQARARPHAGDVAGPGSTVRAVVARTACPVVVVRRERAAGPRQGIVVGVEEHGRAQGALRAAMEQAARDRVAVTAVHAWDVPMSEQALYDFVPPSPDAPPTAPDAASRLMSEAVAGLAEDFPTVDLGTRLDRGPVVDVLRGAAEHADLLVIGRHTESRLDFHALGHAARALLHDAPCPLMVVAPSGPTRAKTRNLLTTDVPIGTGF